MLRDSVIPPAATRGALRALETMFSCGFANLTALCGMRSCIYLPGMVLFQAKRLGSLFGLGPPANRWGYMYAPGVFQNRVILYVSRCALSLVYIVPGASSIQYKALRSLEGTIEVKIS